MNITLESRKTTWVSFIDTYAKMKAQWNCTAFYNIYNIKDNTPRSVNMKYTLFDLKNKDFIPSSQLIIKKEGIPQTITHTVVSSKRDSFSSEHIDDPFVEVQDNLANVIKKDLKEKRLSKTMLERTWTEYITRSIKIANKNEHDIHLILKIQDDPAQELTFKSSDPQPKGKEPPEYIYEFNIKAEKEILLKIEFIVKQKETIKTPHSRRSHAANEEFSDMEFEEAAFSNMEMEIQQAQQFEE